MPGKKSKAKAKSTKTGAIKGKNAKASKASGKGLPIGKRNVLIHTIHVPKGTDEIVIRVVCGGPKTRTLAMLGSSSDTGDDIGGG